MESPAYIMGALGVLVKAGELSPHYAAGVASVLEKRAISQQNLHDAYVDFLKSHPGRVGRTEKGDEFIQDLHPDEAVDILDNAKGWFEGDGVSWGDTFRNWLGRLSTISPGNPKTLAMYKREYRDLQNRARLKKIREGRLQLAPELMAALQEAHMRDAACRVADAKRTMLAYDREKAGLTDNYPDTYRTELGDMAIARGLYTPVYHEPRRSDDTYGENLPDSFGGNKHMFYRAPYLNPLFK